MADVVLTLKFNTAEAQSQVQKLSESVRSSLVKAFAITPTARLDLSKSLGINTAITGVQRLRAELTKVNNNLSGGINRSRLRNFGSLNKDGSRSGGVSSLFESVLSSLPFGGGAGGAVSARADPRHPLRAMATSKEKRGGALIPTELVVNALEAELRDRRDDNVKMRKSGEAVIDARKQEASETMAGVRRRQRIAKADEVLRGRVVPVPNAREIQGRAGGTRTPIPDIISSERRAARTRLDTDRRAYLASSRTTANGPQTFQEFRGARGIGGARQRPRTTPQQALGISRAATGLLAASSVVAPLSPQLGATLMGAGFSAFSLGAPIAALALFSSALAGLVAVLKKSVAAAKEAKLETVGWSRSTIKLKLEIQGFLNEVGVKTQQAFIPVVNNLVKLFQEIEGLPWGDIIDRVSRGANSFVNLGHSLVFMGKKYKGFLDTITAFTPMKLIPKGVGFAWGVGQDLVGAEGKQRMDIKEADFPLGIFNPLSYLLAAPKILTELKELFGKDKGPENEPFGGFVFTPKFDLKNVEDVGKSIQKGLLADAGKSPEVKAIETLQAIQRLDLQVSEKIEKNLRDRIKGQIDQVPVLH